MAGFDCGKPALNAWLRDHAAKSEGSTARTYVVCEGRKVIGYYCISAGSIERAAMPAKVKKHGLPNPIPVAIIGRLARDLSYKGAGLGADLLSDAVKRVAAASEILGVRAIIVHALDADSVPFYSRYGFMPCSIGDKTLFLPLETISAAI
jgi:predicted GNAT family N-acyltransferase